MSAIGLTPEHDELRDVAARWLAAHSPAAVVRDGLDTDDDPPTPGGRAFAELGWTGLAVPEPIGSGAGLLEASVVLEQAGRAMLPGPLLPSMHLAVVLARADAAKDALAAVAAGDAGGTVAWRAGSLTGRATGAGVTVSG